MSQPESPNIQKPVGQIPASDDLGIGRIQAEQSTRFLNKDGSFNTRRIGLDRWESLNPFYALISMTWQKFFSMLVAGFVVINIFFAALYWLSGPNALTMSTPDPINNLFLRAFFFSVETLSTIGYGHIAPNTIFAHVISSTEAFLGLLLTAVMTGVIFARFSKPNSRILWSKNILIAPFQNNHDTSARHGHDTSARHGQAIMFRIANGFRNEIIDIEAQVNLAWFETINGKRVRKFHNLLLERSKVAFFSLAWTVVHPINSQSPLWGISEAELLASEAEFVIVIKGLDDVLFQPVHGRGSYKSEEIIWNAKFTNMYVPNASGGVAIDVRKLSDYVAAQL